MADITLEAFQRSQSQQISRDIIAQSEEQNRKMQLNAHKLWENAHEQLIKLLRFLDQDYDEAYEKGNHPLDSFNDNDLAYLILIRVRSLKQNNSIQGSIQEIDLLRKQIMDISEKFNETEKQRNEILEKNKMLLQETERLNSHISALRQANLKDEFHEDHPILVDPSDQKEKPVYFPTWFTSWEESRGFEKTSTAILAMGKSGKSLRPSVTKEMARALKTSPDNGSLDEAITRLIEPEQGTYPQMIEKIDTFSSMGSSSGGNRPDIIRLTDAGKLAYQLLTDQIALENEYDRFILHHSSPEHTVLNIQASEILEETGYIIRSQVPQIQLHNGSTFIPDIVAADRSTGETIFIEVERDTHKDQVTRKQKWINFYEASNGNLFVFCDNLTCQRSVQAEINIALGDLHYNSSLTNLHGLRQGKRSENGGIWLSGKQKSR